MSRICVSVPVHENPAVVLDQVENIRAFMPAGTLIVLHLSQTFGQRPVDVQKLMPEGVLINPVCMPTAWGDFIQAHLSNIDFALSTESFDYVLLQASNDMYVRAGAGDYISKHDAGFNREVVRPGKIWGLEDVALEDPALQSIVNEIGATELVSSQVEGTFYNAELFANMIALIRKHWQHGEGEVYPREEIYFPTIANHWMKDARATPIIYSESTHSPITAGHIWRLAEGTYRETPESLSQGIGLHEGARYDYENVYGVKRINRIIDDPLRVMIRGLTRSMGSSMRTPSPVDSGNAAVVAYLDDLLNYPEGLWLWAYQFRAIDPVTMVVLAYEGDSTQEKVDAFVRLAQHAGIEAVDAANVEVLVVPKDGFIEASLRWSALGRFEMEHPQYRLDDVPVFGPRALGGLREYVRQSAQSEVA